VRGGDEDVLLAEAARRQAVADLLQQPPGHHEQVDRDERDLLVAALQHEGPRVEPRVLAVARAVLARPAAEVVAELRRDVGLADAGLERGRGPLGGGGRREQREDDDREEAAPHASALCRSWSNARAAR
jgi:hypothetical protein